MVRDSMALEFERASADQSERAVAQVPTARKVMLNQGHLIRVTYNALKTV